MASEVALERDRIYRYAWPWMDSWWTRRHVLNCYSGQAWCRTLRMVKVHGCTVLSDGITVAVTDVRCLQGELHNTEVIRCALHVFRPLLLVRTPDPTCDSGHAGADYAYIGRLSCRSAWRASCPHEVLQLHDDEPALEVY